MAVVLMSKTLEQDYQSSGDYCYTRCEYNYPMFDNAEQAAAHANRVYFGGEIFYYADVCPMTGMVGEFSMFHEFLFPIKKGS